MGGCSVIDTRREYWDGSFMYGFIAQHFTVLNKHLYMNILTAFFLDFGLKIDGNMVFKYCIEFVKNAACKLKKAYTYGSLKVGLIEM